MKLGAFLSRRKCLDYCDKSVPMISEIFNDADNSLFEGIMKNCNNVLHDSSLLPWEAELVL